MTDRWLVGLDIDGTLMLEDGSVSERVVREVQRVRDLGHEVTLATGRSVSMTTPVLDRFALTPEFVVCANGAITLGRDDDAPMGYSRVHVETFDPRGVLTTLRGHLAGASFAVEDAEGVFRYSGNFPEGALAASRQRVDFEELVEGPATRVVVISPDHETDEFLKVVESIGLHRVSYNIGWTAWLDIAPDGVNKGTAMERVRDRLGIPRDRVLVVGDGRNDIDMFAWAARDGVAVAMGQSPDEVVAASNDRTGTDLDDGVAEVLARRFQS